jgi:hypothetical protein
LLMLMLIVDADTDHCIDTDADHWFLILMLIIDANADHWLLMVITLLHWIARLIIDYWCWLHYCTLDSSSLALPLNESVCQAVCIPNC